MSGGALGRNGGGTGRRTAQRMEAASALSRASGMGVTWVTQETTYWEKVPSTVKPEYLPFRQPVEGGRKR